MRAMLFDLGKRVKGREAGRKNDDISRGEIMGYDD